MDELASLAGELDQDSINLKKALAMFKVEKHLVLAPASDRSDKGSKG
jgi:hypothetical protein